MIVSRIKVLALAGACANLCLVSPAWAITLPNHTFVSKAGNDGNACSTASPCATFSGALAKTNAGGMIECLDTSDYGAVSINKSITIECGTSGAGSMVVTSGDGITISAGAADSVVLSGLVLDGAHSAFYGIYAVTVGTLIVRNSQIRNFTGWGLVITNSTNTQLTIEDCSFVGHAAGGVQGRAVVIDPVGTANIRFLLRGVSGLGSYRGFIAYGDDTTGTVQGTIADSTFNNNDTDGVTAHNTSGHAAFVSISLNNVETGQNGAAGILADGPSAGFLVNNSNIVGNAAGLTKAAGGVIYSYGNNRVNGNHGTDGAFTGTLPMH